LCPAGSVVIITTLRPPEPFVTPFLSFPGATRFPVVIEPEHVDGPHRFRSAAAHGCAARIA